MDHVVQIVAHKSRGQRLFKPIGRAKREGGRIRVSLDAIPAHRTLYIEGLDLGDDGGRGREVYGYSPGKRVRVNIGRALRTKQGGSTNLLLDAVPTDLVFYINV